MNTGGEAADQIVKMSLNGVEVAAKITGAGAKQLAILLYTILKEQDKTKGCLLYTSLLRPKRVLRRRIARSFVPESQQGTMMQ